MFYKTNVKIFYSETNDEKHFDELVSNTLPVFSNVFYKKPIYKNL